MEVKRFRLLEYLQGENLSANETIEAVYQADLAHMGATNLCENVGWKFYLALNKLFSPMENECLIQCIGTIDGEKIWGITELGFAMMQEETKEKNDNLQKDVSSSAGNKKSEEIH